MLEGGWLLYRPVGGANFDHGWQSPSNTVLRTNIVRSLELPSLRSASHNVHPAGRLEGGH